MGTNNTVSSLEEATTRDISTQLFVNKDISWISSPTNTKGHNVDPVKESAFI